MKILLPNGQSLVPEKVTLSHGEGDALWSATVALIRADHYAALALDTEIEVTLGGVTWRLIVHARDRQADGVGGWRYSVEAVSPVIRLTDRYAARVNLDYTGTVNASKVVADLLAGFTLHWRMIDWAIPADRLASRQGEPLALARRIARAAGGVLESLPDGSLVARAEFPVAVPDLPAAAADHRLDDLTDLIRLRETLTVERLVNRLVIADSLAALGGTAQGRDQLRAVVRDNGFMADLTAMPDPWRPVSLAVSAGAGSLSPPVTETRRVDEIVAIENGRGTLSQAAVGQPTLTWIGPAPARWVLEGDGRTLTTEPGHYTLARAQYQYQVLTAILTAPGPGATQVVMKDNGRITAATTVDIPLADHVVQPEAPGQAATPFDASSTRATDGRKLVYAGALSVELVPGPGYHLAIAPRPDRALIADGSLQYLSDESAAPEEVALAFNADRAQRLPWPDVTDVEVAHVLASFTADGGPATDVTFGYDPDSRSIVASQPVYATVRVRFRRRYAKYAFTYPTRPLPNGGVSIQPAAVLAQRGVRATAQLIEPPRLLNPYRAVELLRVTSKAVVDPKGTWEYPPGFPDKTWADYGYDGQVFGYPTPDFPDVDNHLVVERTHALVVAELDNGRWSLRDSYENVPQALPHENWKLQAHWGRVDEEAFKAGAYEALGLVLDTLKNRLGTALDLKLNDMPAQLRARP